MTNYAIENRIIVGEPSFPLYRFYNDKIVKDSLNGIFSVDPIGNELRVDTFSVVIRYDPDAVTLYAPEGNDGYLDSNDALYTLNNVAGRDYMMELPYGTPVYWFAENERLAKGYLQKVERLTKYSWKLTMISGVGLLSDSYHVGGIYEGETFGEIVSDVIGTVFPFSVSQDLALMPVFGWLPYDTRRNNLHRLLIAYGASLLRTDETVDYVIGWLEMPDDAAVIPDSRIAINGKTEYELPATGVEVTEHTFAQTPEDETVQLIDTTVNATGGEQFVVFSEPCYGFQKTGSLSIVESGVNYAIVTGLGVLTGKKYTHNTNLVSMSTGAATTPRIKRITDNCIISAVNVQNVASRLLAYFSSAKTVRSKLILQGEQAGTPYAFNDSFGDPTLGYLQQVQLGISSVKAATCDFVEGYRPTNRGIYSHSLVLTGSGSWTPPEGVTDIQIVMIGGGQGGRSGSRGEYGWGRDDGGYHPVGTGYGGEGGEGGQAGKSHTVRITDASGAYAYSCGTGGASDSDGGDTTFGEYSSADGEVAPRGVTDVITGHVYALKGETGVRGGSGASSGSYRPIVVYKGGAWIAGEQGASYVQIPASSGYGIDGGTGGGAAVGSAGGDGYSYGIQDTPVRYIGGNGGHGATPIDGEDATIYGNGGNGGHGGGGGGRGGVAHMSITAYNVNGYGGEPGNGSQGGRGGDGCVIVYY